MSLLHEFYSHLPIELESYFWLVCIEMVCSNACYGLYIHVVMVQYIFIDLNSIGHVIQPLKEKDIGSGSIESKPT